jgi:glycosyltransferase involved in cell wall biosynthesis
MTADPRYPPPHGDTWTPLIATREWCAREPHWRGRERGRPVAGRHGRDHVLKWPGARRDLLDAYCAGRACEVRFLGGAAHARTIAGRWPANWTAEEFGTRDVRKFLSGLDFFLHYPHDDYIEEFGRAPMEAMAIGVPVILPPVFRATFGAAALYAEPRDVWAAMERLWADEKAWMERIEAGRAFVMSNCSPDLFPARLRPEGNAPWRQAHMQGEGR